MKSQKPAEEQLSSAAVRAYKKAKRKREARVLERKREARNKKIKDLMSQKISPKFYDELPHISYVNDGLLKDIVERVNKEIRSASFKNRWEFNFWFRSTLMPTFKTKNYLPYVFGTENTKKGIQTMGTTTFYSTKTKQKEKEQKTQEKQHSCGKIIKFRHGVRTA